jgi:hypothetical protein
MTFQQEEAFLQSINLDDENTPNEDKLLALNILLNRPDEELPLFLD